MDSGAQLSGEGWILQQILGHAQALKKNPSFCGLISTLHKTLLQLGLTNGQPYHVSLDLQAHEKKRFTGYHCI